MARSKSSARWLQEHFNDPYVLKAQQLGYRSRAVFKLQELDDKDRLLKAGMSLIDLGAAPGGWSQYVVEKLSGHCQLLALDILPMEPLVGVDFIQGDFREQAVLDQILDHLQQQKVDLVMSDMAPNMSGVESADQARSIYLAELALELANQTLKPGGSLLMKTFQGSGFDSLMQDCRQQFKVVKVRKPAASRDRSSEVYILAQQYQL